MALTYDELQAVARDYIEKGKVTDCYFKGNALALRLFRNPKYFTGGEKLQETLWKTNMNGGAYEGVGNFDTDLKEIHTKALFAWQSYYVYASISGREEASCSGDSQVVDLWQSKIKNAAMTMNDNLGTDLHSATAAANGKVLTLIADLFNGTTSTAYGEIAEDDLSEWKANRYSWSGKSFTLANWKAMRRLAKVGNEVPDLYVTSDDVYDAFEDLLQPAKRYQADDLARVGFNSLMLDSRGAVTADQKQTYSAGSGYIIGLNTDHFFARMHKNQNFTWSKVHELHDGDAKGMKLLTYIAFTTDARRTHVLGHTLTI